MNTIYGDPDSGIMKKVLTVKCPTMPTDIKNDDLLWKSMNTKTVQTIC